MSVCISSGEREKVAVGSADASAAALASGDIFDTHFWGCFFVEKQSYFLKNKIRILIEVTSKIILRATFWCMRVAIETKNVGKANYGKCVSPRNTVWFTHVHFAKTHQFVCLNPFS